MFGGLTDDIPSSYTALPNGPTYLMMLAEGERRLAADVRRLLHEELGSSIPVANMNGGTLPMAFVAANDAYDYDDKHRYVDHPSFVEEGWRLPATPGSGNRNFVSGNHVGSIYSVRMIDRPFTISEDNLCTPWRNAAASGFAIGAIAALQGTAATYRFSWANLENYGTPERQTPGSYFNVTANPLMAASERLAIALFPRGDLGAYAKRYVYTVDPAFMASTNAANADTPMTYFPFGWAAWRARVGFVSSTEVPAGAIDAGAWPGMMRKLRPEICTDLGIDRPSGTETLPDGSTVNVDFDAGSLAVATPRTAAGYAESGTVVAGPLTAKLNGTASTVWVSSLDGCPLSRSVRMLFGHLTEAQAEGRTFADPGFSTLLRWGGPQNLMRAGRADVALALGGGRFKVYALAADGTRRFRVPCTATGGVLRFTADVAADPALATCQYEIVRGGGIKVIVR